MNHPTLFRVLTLTTLLSSLALAPGSRPPATARAAPAPTATTWVGTYGGRNLDSAFSLVATADGGYAVAGYTYSFGAGDSDVWVLKLDAAGAVLWQQTYGGSSTDSAQSLVATADGGYAVAGYTSSFGAGGGDVWVLKLDANGQAGEMCSLMGESNATVADSSAVPQSTSARVANSTATVTDSNAVPQNSQATTTLQCAGSPDTLHVGGIEGRYRAVGQRFQLGAEILILDESGAPVPRARVTGSIDTPDGRRVWLAGPTGPQGRVWNAQIVTTPGTYTFCVTDVRKDGWTYDPSQNVETCDQVVVE